MRLLKSDYLSKTYLVPNLDKNNCYGKRSTYVRFILDKAGVEVVIYELNRNVFYLSINTHFTV